MAGIRVPPGMALQSIGTVDGEFSDLAPLNYNILLTELRITHAELRCMPTDGNRQWSRSASPLVSLKVVVLACENAPKSNH